MGAEMKILIVEDEPLARKALSKLLEARPDVTSVVSAADAVTALSLVKKHVPDILFLDINMPEMSGLELLERLSESEKTMPAVVFVTAHSGHAVAAFEHHAVDYVLKPFSDERIEKALFT